MLIIPAIDIRGGKCVRLVQGEFHRETVFAENAVEMALHWSSRGARRLHVVDLDGARTGEPRNADTIRRIVQSIGIPVQVGGGIRTTETADIILSLGVDRVIIGTSAALDASLAREFFRKFGDRVILGLDAKDGFVATHGWKKITDLKAVEFARKMEESGARRIIHTDIGTDGMLSGVNLKAMEDMARAVGIPVIASGGVTNIRDIQNLKTLEPLGIEGAIIGKALYTGSIVLEEAIRAAE